MLLRPEKVLIEPEPHPDLQWDIAFVYSRKYKTFLVDQIGYCQDKVRIVGNPEYDEAIRIWHDTNVEEICKEYLFALNVKMNYRDKNIILWLDEALVEMNTITEDERIYELGIIAKAAAQNGYDVIVKSHPASDITMIKEFCKSRPHLHFIEKAELGILVWLSSFTIGHSSTALLLPVILGRPIYGLEKLAGREIPHQNYNSVIQTFCPEDISNIFSNPQKFYFTDSRKDQIKTFLENNVGPTDGLTVDRIIESVKVLAGNN